MAFPADASGFGLSGAGAEGAAAAAAAPLPPPEPITIPQAINDLLLILLQVRHRLKTLIDWYIYPEIVPNEIQAYDPRLVILQSRLKSLATLSYTQLPYLIDDSDGLAAQYLMGIVGQLLNAIHGIQSIFVNHYDRDLEERRPFASIWETLNYREDQLKQVPGLSPSNPRRLRPEDLRASDGTSTHELGRAFCRGALQISNNRDRGRISFVDRKDLAGEKYEQQKLKAFGGAFLHWECRDGQCAYRVRYHVASSVTSNIHTTDEIREHDRLAVQYRSSFLAKSHLYLPAAVGHKQQQQQQKTSLKYGCVFCFATTRHHQLVRGYSAFATARDLIAHIALEHRNPLPPSLMLHRFLVAVNGKALDDRKRWDLNLLKD
ncbi:hypothetical protein A1O1_03517 [Capronia coronata CBS 617.96]|uniref:Uncharacterized protein n=1 Tax=Capronia coronata CBS 617.96 TaxID=1182541 RepID=W9YMG8_9EURO|nr:uncharacterized protein A1O1_03517 [Capronia coronata CBS 617.96]EXJ90416.1 hypothetical protein A1O1_03517 [Capronia coronata CBS 617.96]